MLERIHKIANVGLFRDIRPAALNFKKMTVIYADNGRGKSTLASILRSYTDNIPDIVRYRKTLGQTTPQEINLQFSNGDRAVFSNEAWSGKYADVHVFDLDFVDSNVYSGGEINAGHRKRLLSFALGSDAVAAKTAFSTASDLAEEAKKATRSASDKLTGYRGNVTLAKYIKLAAVENIEQIISGVQSELDVCARIDTIRKRGGYQQIPLLTPDLTKVFTTLSRTFDSIGNGAEEAVNSHINHISTEGFERWVSSGLDFIKDDLCPFCSQNLAGVGLIRHYQEHFNQAYRSHIKQVSDLDTDVMSVMRAFNVALLESKIQQAGTVAPNWQDCLPISVALPNIERIKAHVEAVQSLLDSVTTIKARSPLCRPDGDYENNVAGAIDAINAELEAFNTSALSANHTIQVYKETLDEKNEADLRTMLAQHEATRQRQSAEVEEMIAEYVTAKAAETIAIQLKETRRDELNQIMDATLGRYEASINDLLIKFGASFSIKEINYNYAGGGEPKSEYAIEMRGEKISLTGEEASFRTSLSEGDKRTLAFAFFISVLFHDEDLDKKIVVIDDPMCSLDSHRRSHTINIIKQTYARSRQVIILAHDLHFIRTMRDEFLRMSTTQPQDLSALRIVHSADDFSALDRLEIDLECESPYYKNHRLVSGYIAGTHHNLHDTAVAIRPLLEGYLHRRFPGRISSGSLFGEIVQQIALATSDDPLLHAQSLVAELNEINSYAGRFHHDTNPAASSEVISPIELRAFSRRALEVMYRGTL
ncbi:AAA family ATPase [Pantoea trifolii]|uniref:AAA family ATPase n=1 Tax=Pantoea trifolii TaxID=2968030 RepID=UPI003EDA9A2D